MCPQRADLQSDKQVSIQRLRTLLDEIEITVLNHGGKLKENTGLMTLHVNRTKTDYQRQLR